jgi:penicillin-binding protein 1A
MGGMLPAEIWQAFMKKATAQTPAKNFDGSRSSNYGGVGELEDDKKQELKKTDTKKKDDKKDADKKDAKKGADKKSDPNNKQNNNPAAPPVAAPEPGGVGKGRN